MKEFEIVVIGGGPAGISAAIQAARVGAKVALVDENQSLGGKVFSFGAPKIGMGALDRLEREIRKNLFEDFNDVKDQVALYQGAEVWGFLDSKTVGLYRAEDPLEPSLLIRGKKLIICPGTCERAVPFEGWTLPGVFSMGGMNLLVKKGVLPGKRFLVAGSGPLQILLTLRLIQAGAHIEAVVIGPSLKSFWAQALPGILTLNCARWRTGWEFFWETRRKGIPLFRSHVICKGEGEEELQRAQIVQVDSAWKPVPGTEKFFETDAVAYGYGLIPCIELTRLCGCGHVYDDSLGYWKVEADEKLQTNMPGVFVAGDGRTVKGYEAAIEEGRAAAIQAGIQLGRLREQEVRRELQSLRVHLKRFEKLGKAMDRISLPGPEILDILTNDTVICRCEEVSLSDIAAAVDEGVRDLNDLKRRTRLGMGHCQGRLCGQWANELLWKLRGVRTERGAFTPRPPAKPISFEGLAKIG